MNTITLLSNAFDLKLAFSKFCRDGSGDTIFVELCYMFEEVGFDWFKTYQVLYNYRFDVPSMETSEQYFNWYMTKLYGDENNLKK